MPICVECGSQVPEIYKVYGKDTVRMTICHSCNQVADKYVEFDFVLIFIDMVLQRQQVYRHIFYNSPEFDKWNPALKILFMYIFFDSYDQWSTLIDSNAEWNSQEALFNYGSVVFQSCFLFFIFLIVVLISCRYFFFKNNQLSEFRFYQKLTQSLIISCWGKVLTILTLIWDYDPSFINFNLAVNLFVFSSNILTLKVLTNCDIILAIACISLAYFVRIFFENFIF